MQIETLISQLNDVEKEEVKKNNFSTIEDIIPLLLSRVTIENVHTLADILKQSLQPSICDDNNEDIDTIFEQIDKEPQLLFKKEIQEKIEGFISNRFERDKKVVIKRTSDISKFVVLMGQYLNEAISSNGSGSQNVLSIKEKIQAIKIDDGDTEALTNLQTELINAATSIESEMNTVTNKLQSGKTKVQELEEKVKSLEEELSRTKNESMKDHLTGLLTRRAYTEEIKKIESSFTRNNTQYAVVFFDLDHFKKLNDNFGHECGDVVLSTFAKILAKYTRDHDVVCRYGGEEFVAIVHFKLNRELLQYLKRIKMIVTENSFIYNNQKIKITFSAGVAIRNNYENYHTTLQKADMLLYDAKEKGRNRILLENGQEI
ncbi:hypothetical protein GCM10012288_22010 [Malaciobacter pacificus]|uniref:diguanylate cyclase n=1 Tax=Malaciobacter pacificus TaxID=1080223 RepID=A0A5C2HC06_9BACT|nr:GGDEF domain-containing protein [Malaciobacter pacificus]QEP34746.1 diguanylate cyclase [Malaciobacter pacificus]GGD47391.1 hypothetical protein GCM10012288_22010 [Malaciobacter pacificus]